MSDFGPMIASDADQTKEAHLRNHVLVVLKKIEKCDVFLYA